MSDSAGITLGDTVWRIDLTAVGEDGFELTIWRNDKPVRAVGWTEDPQGRRDFVTFDGASSERTPNRWTDSYADGGRLDWVLHGSHRVEAVVRDADGAARFNAVQDAPRKWRVDVAGPFPNREVPGT